MNWKWKRKWLISLAVTVSMVFSTVGTAAATGPTAPTATVDTGSEMGMDAGEKAEPDLGGGTTPDSGDVSDPDNGDVTDPDNGDVSDPDNGDVSDPDNGDVSDPDNGDVSDLDNSDVSDPDNGDVSDPDNGDVSDPDNSDVSDPDNGNVTDPDNGDVTDPDNGNVTDPDNGNVTDPDDSNVTDPDDSNVTDPDNGDVSDPDDSNVTDPDSGDGTGPNDEDVTAPDDEGATGPDSGDAANPGSEDETGSATGDEPAEDGLPEAPDEEAPVDPENPGGKPSIDLIPDLSDHNWSTEWSYDETYHWHECDDEDCLVTDNSEKDGYGEHSYGIDNACTICGYTEPVSQFARAGVVPTYEEAYEAMTALQDDKQYKEGTEWTNFTPYGSKGTLGDSYAWKGGRILGASRGVGCAAFAFILSDAAFDNLPARAVANGKFTFEDVKVGDILRVNNNSHSVIVLKKSAGGVIVAEANYNKSVHWGRAMSKSEVLKADHVITRYPEGYEEDNTGDEELARDEGKAGSLDWILTNGGELTISGNGAIPNYSTSSPAPWYQYKSDIYTVIIGDGVTEIGEYAFYESGVLSIHIPDSAERIGANAFEKSGLISVTIPGSVVEIGHNAFRDCANLTSASVSEGVESIGDNAFRGCRSLEYIDFPASITSVGAGAFTSCDAMTRVRFMPGTGTVTLGAGLFAQCQHLTDVTLPQTSDCISENMFQSCTSLPQLYIPASVKEIGENPFTSCKALKYIYFGGSEADWKALSNPRLEGSLQSTGTKVICNAEFKDPFAPDPDDPGDLLPDGDGDETDPPEPDGDGSGHKHSWSPVWSQDGTAHWHECSDGCSITDNRKKDGYGKHSFGGWIIDANATASQSGSRHRDCTVCGYRQTGRIPATGSTGGSDDSSGDSSGGNSGSSGGSDDSSSDNSSDSSSESDSGASTTVEQLPDGSSVATTTQKDGTVTKVTTDGAGQTRTEVSLSASAVTTAQQRGEAVSLPVPAVPVVRDVAAAPAITVHSGSESVTAAIPAVAPTPGTVAVIVHEDGSTEVIQSTAVTGSSVVAVVPNGATVKIVDNSKSYPDVPAENRFSDAVAFVSARNLMDGTTETAFTPDGPMTNAALVTALARLDGVPTQGGTTWYAKGMEWAAARGIGSGAGPDSNMSGEELIATLWSYKGSPAVPELPIVGSGAAGNTRTAMAWATKNGIISGFEPGTLNLQGQITRGQAAQIMMNLVNHPYSSMVPSPHP